MLDSMASERPTGSGGRSEQQQKLEGDGSATPRGRFKASSISITATTPPDRLPSLKPKRDLTLGGVKKKVFTPTIPARRQKKPTENVSSETKPSPSKSAPSRQDGRRKGERDHRQEKGARRKKEVITASSVFSMGPAERMMESRRERATFGRMSSSRPEQSATKTESNTSDPNKNDIEPMDVQTVAEGEEAALFLDSLVPPIKLPLDYDTGGSHKETTPSSTANNLKIKKESSVEEMEVSPAKPFERSAGLTGSSTGAQSMQVSELFSPSEDSKGQFLLLQFPDRLPLPPPVQEQASDSKEPPTPAVKTDKNEKQPNISYPTLRDVPEGVIGKIRVHRSGEVKLVLGNITLDVAMGTRGGFLQELSSVKVSEPPTLTILGQLSHRLVCVPDLLSTAQDDR